MPKYLFRNPNVHRAQYTLFQNDSKMCRKIILRQEYAPMTILYYQIRRSFQFFGEVPYEPIFVKPWNSDVFGAQNRRGMSPKVWSPNPTQPQKAEPKPTPMSADPKFYLKNPWNPKNPMGTSPNLIRPRLLLPEYITNLSSFLWKSSWRL